MLPWFILGFGLLIGAMVLLRWMATAEPKDLAKVLRWVGIVLISGFFLILLATGRMNWIIATAGAALPFLMRAWRVWQITQNVRRANQWAQGMAGGQGNGGWQSPGGGGDTSAITTRFLNMQLDHDTGAISGVITAGPMAGRRLDDLQQAEVLDLHSHYDRVDDESRQVLEAYMDRAFPDWREGAEETNAGRHRDEPGAEAAGGPIGREEALSILGLHEGATKADITKAYHRLMAGVHPDHGGSDYLASQLNAARDILLKGL